MVLLSLGECWSGGNANSYKAVGKADNKKCTGNEYKKCSPFSRHCVGQQFTNFVYEIGELKERCSWNPFQSNLRVNNP